MTDLPASIEDVRDLLTLGLDSNNNTDDALQYYWRIQRNGKTDEGPMAKYFGFIYRDSTPEYIGHHNLELEFEEFSTHTLRLLNHGELSNQKLHGDPEAPIVYVKYNGNYHMIDGNKRIRYWYDRNDEGPHKVCVLLVI